MRKSCIHVLFMQDFCEYLKENLKCQMTSPYLIFCSMTSRKTDCDRLYWLLSYRFLKFVIMCSYIWKWFSWRVYIVLTKFIKRYVYGYCYSMLEKRLKQYYFCTLWHFLISLLAIIWIDIKLPHAICPYGIWECSIYGWVLYHQKNLI